MTSARVLIIDDEPAIQRSLSPLFRSRGYLVEVAATGADGIALERRWQPHVVVLDLGLPDVDGPEVCRRIRSRSTVPIIVLSARSTDADKIGALDLGADDYVTKPFSPEELLARVRVALRRVFSADEAEEGQVDLGGLTIDFGRRRVTANGRDVRLTPKEFDLLALLARHRDRVLTHRVILKTIWGPNAVEQPEHLWVLVGQVRKKIEADASKPRFLLSEPWVGYRLASSAPDA